MDESGTEPDESRRIRSFFAIPFAAKTCSSIADLQKEISEELPGLQLTPRNNLHLTLHFFGNITEENLETAAEIVVSIGSLFIPFTLTLNELGAFPSTTRPRIVWLGTECPRLMELQYALQTRLQAARFPIEDRPFKPHITIGRSKQQKRHILSQRQNKVAINVQVDRLVLYESRQQPAGVEYRPRQTVRLAEPEKQR